MSMYASIKEFFKRLDKKGREQITLMFVPHSQKKIRTFHISHYIIAFTIGGALLISLIAFGLLTNRSMRENEKTYHIRIQGEYAYQTEALSEDISNFLLQTDYRNDLHALFATAGLIKPGDALAAVGGVDAELSDADNAVALKHEDLLRMEEVINELAVSQEYLANMEKKTRARKTFIDNIPTISPFVSLSGVMKTKAKEKSFEAVCVPSTPIRATASGKVQRVGYVDQYGCMELVVQHEYGMKTAYRGLGRIDAKEGKKVAKGEIIGYTTGGGYNNAPFVYQILVASAYVTPTDYMLDAQD